MSLVLIVLFKFYYHHLRKVKNGQPLYTPYDLGVHRQHRHMYASPEKPFVSKFLIPLGEKYKKSIFIAIYTVFSSIKQLFARLVSDFISPCLSV
ncbi:hypothetical protein IscW_ISCW008372 [Ixodes scapularis]|uniref:Uncharacterized protein n=1 Tax=Ixodes scapularis TaxID=6945 RepID=B7PUG5_IXOSC|nr:hypothetical protein IscW_ISCW008372 [Ixodes scapularis]|eukprot:XP_002406000.1 hypothetical protein IscW_ISCW008372 [Ixodes scapularis]